MTRACWRVGLFVAGGLLLSAGSIQAQVVPNVHFGAGVFVPRGENSRVKGDTLVADLTDVDPLVFEIKDFRTGHVFAEWNGTFRDRVEVGFSAGFAGRSVPTVYRGLEDEITGAEIEQRLTLRVAPIMAVVRFLPLGYAGELQPYVGVAAGVVHFRYTEEGDFVDPSDLSIFPDRFNIQEPMIVFSDVINDREVHMTFLFNDTPWVLIDGLKGLTVNRT
jgi:hypothetical protein